MTMRHGRSAQRQAARIGTKQDIDMVCSNQTFDQHTTLLGIAGIVIVGEAQQ